MEAIYPCSLALTQTPGTLVSPEEAHLQTHLKSFIKPGGNSTVTFHAYLATTGTLGLTVLPGTHTLQIIYFILGLKQLKFRL